MHQFVTFELQKREKNSNIATSEIFLFNLIQPNNPENLETFADVFQDYADQRKKTQLR